MKLDSGLILIVSVIELDADKIFGIFFEINYNVHLRKSQKFVFVAIELVDFCVAVKILLWY